MEYHDSLHPAILRVLENVFSVSKEHTRKMFLYVEKWLQIQFLQQFLYILGLRKFSMSPSAAPFVFEKVN